MPVNRIWVVAEAFEGKPLSVSLRGFVFINLAPRYFPGSLCSKYLRRGSVSRPCSERERVGPLRPRHQKSVNRIKR